MPARFLRMAMPILCLLGLLWLAPPAAAQAATGVGFSAIHPRDPVNGGSMVGYVFYPSSAPAGAGTRHGPYLLAATADAAALPGRKPLVVISHGHGGAALGHHDLATFLASHGFVVAAIEHPKDNFRDLGGTGHAEVLAGRPVQISATITALLADPRFGALIDARRIGVAGFSAGGYTSLLLVGAVPRFARFLDYCKQYPKDEEICGNADQLKAELARRGQTVEQFIASLQQDLGRWGPTADPRVKAAFAMAPLSLVFDRAGAAKIDRPVFLYYGERDRVLLPPYNARHLKPLVPTLAGVRMVPGADHWVFLAPCSAELAKDVPRICTDPPGVDRAKVHAQIDADALAFFRKYLDAAAR